MELPRGDFVEEWRQRRVAGGASCVRDCSTMEQSREVIEISREKHSKFGCFRRSDEVELSSSSMPLVRSVATLVLLAWGLAACGSDPPADSGGDDGSDTTPDYTHSACYGTERAT